VGSVGDSYDNALAESVIGLYKTEVIRKTDGKVSPAEFEEAYYQSRRARAIGQESCKEVSGRTGAVQ
jgi:transposase InsO family protein